VSALTAAQIAELVALANSFSTLGTLQNVADALYGDLVTAITAEAVSVKRAQEKALVAAIGFPAFADFDAANGNVIDMHGRAMFLCGMLLVDRAQALALLGTGGAP
jgi:hypothetical protein